MHKMVYTSRDFDARRSTDYTLLIHTGRSGDVLAVIDDQSKLLRLAVVDSHQSEQTAELLQLPFGEVKIATLDQGYTFIPIEEFEVSCIPVYSTFLPNEGLTDPLVCEVTPLGIKIVYRLNRLPVSAYLTSLPDAVVRPAVQPFLAMANAYTQVNKPILTIDKAGTVVRIAFFDLGKFSYCSDFEVHDPVDLNYHLLAVMGHVGLEDRKPYVFLSGEIAVDDRYYACVHKYAESVELADAAKLSGISVPSDIQPDAHRFLTLLGMNLCE